MTDTPRADELDRELHASGVLADRYSDMLEHARQIERENARYSETLHDGYMVYENLTHHEKRYTSPETVSAVLDAFKRALSNGNGDQA